MAQNISGSYNENTNVATQINTETGVVSSYNDYTGVSMSYDPKTGITSILDPVKGTMTKSDINGRLTEMTSYNQDGSQTTLTFEGIPHEPTQVEKTAAAIQQMNQFEEMYKGGTMSQKDYEQKLLNSGLYEVNGVYYQSSNPEADRRGDGGPRMVKDPETGQDIVKPGVDIDKECSGAACSIDKDGVLHIPKGDGTEDLIVL